VLGMIQRGKSVRNPCVASVLNMRQSTTTQRNAAPRCP
jgi:hypothetical protein